MTKNPSFIGEKCFLPTCQNIITKHQRKSCSPECGKKLVELNRKKAVWTDEMRSKMSARVVSEDTKAKRKDTNQLRYGGNAPASSSDVQTRMKTTSMQRYGVDHFMKTADGKERVKTTTMMVHSAVGNASPKIRDKQRHTLQSRYGVDFALQNQNSLTKMKETSIERHGGVGAAGCETYKRMKHTNLEKYGTENAMQNQEVSYKSKDVKFEKSSQIYKDIRTMAWWEQHYIGKKTTVLHLCQKFGIGASTMTYIAREVGVKIENPKGISAIEQKLREAIAEFAVVESNTKTVIPPKEIDIFLPEHKIAIEVNGVYWHSMNAGGKERLYHYKKMNLCKHAGIRLYQFWDFEVSKNFDLIVSMIKNACKLNSERIYARKCTPGCLDRATAGAFLKANHLQGDAKFSRAIGLFYDGVLVSALYLGKARFRKGWSEVIRFCSARGVNVVGGFSKLIKASGEQQLVSYSDNRYSQGGLYSASGFVCENIGKPTLWVTKDYSILKHRSALWGLSKLAEYDPKKTQLQNSFDFGYDAVFDAGQTTWTLNKAIPH